MLFSVTYEIVTPESAECGDVDESGFIDQGLTLRDALELMRQTRTSAVDGISAIECDESPVHAPRWVTVINGTEYETGAQESRSLHIPDGITAASRRRIYNLVREAV